MSPHDLLARLKRLYDLGARYVLLSSQTKLPVTLDKAIGSPRYIGLYDDRIRPQPNLCLAWMQAGGGVAYEPASLSLAVLDMDGDGAGDPEATKAQRERGIELCIQRFGQPAAILHSKSGATTGRSHLVYRVTGDAPLGRKKDTDDPYMQANAKMYACPTGPGSGTRFDLKWQRSYCKIPRASYLDALIEIAASTGPTATLDTAIQWGTRHQIKGYRPARKRIDTSIPSLPAIDPSNGKDWQAWSADRIAALPLAEGNRHDALNAEAFVAGLVSLQCPSHIQAVRLAASSAVGRSRMKADVEDGYRAGCRRASR